MSPQTLRLVMLVSCAHALVHVYELALPSVEELIADDFAVGSKTTGLLGNCWRLPFGFGALAAGWLADRFGSKVMLIVYLVGCAATSALVWIAPSLALLFAAMFLMGSFASIYHPAGLALISHEASPEHRPLALGYHGIFGSLGIAGGPFLAALLLWSGASWRQYYLVLVVPGALLAVFMIWRMTEHHRRRQPSPSDAKHSDEGFSRAQLVAYLTLISIGAIGGFIYAAMVNFLPRYLGESNLRIEGIPPQSFRNGLAAAVLLLGCVGQYVAGRFARPHRLTPILVCILLSTVPFLFWMSFAQGTARVWAAAFFALTHFSHQPIYNSLVAHYVPSSRRSLGFGLSNFMTFGVGSFGAGFAGYVQSEPATNYGTLACLALVGAAIAAWLYRFSGRNGL